MSKSQSTGFASRFKLICSGRTQCEVSVFLDIPQATVSGYQTGRIEPRVITAQRIAEAFGVSLDWLLTGRGDREMKRKNKS